MPTAPLFDRPLLHSRASALVCLVIAALGLLAAVVAAAVTSPAARAAESWDAAAGGVAGGSLGASVSNPVLVGAADEAHRAPTGWVIPAGIPAADRPTVAPIHTDSATRTDVAAATGPTAALAHGGGPATLVSGAAAVAAAGFVLCSIGRRPVPVRH